MGGGRLKGEEENDAGTAILPTTSVTSAHFQTPDGELYVEAKGVEAEETKGDEGYAADGAEAEMESRSPTENRRLTRRIELTSQG